MVRKDGMITAMHQSLTLATAHNGLDEIEREVSGETKGVTSPCSG